MADRHHVHIAALGVMIVSLGASGATHSVCERDAGTGVLYLLIAVLGALLCTRASEMAHMQGRQAVLSEMLLAMRLEREEKDHDPVASSPPAVVESQEENRVAQAGDLRRGMESPRP